MKKKYQRGTDSVDAKLTPRESVLNRNASELLGRHNIAMLNYHGNMLAKRGVDLASLPSDPTPGPSTENMLGYQMGTSMVQRDDRADLLRDADNTFYGGGHIPAPTPTPTPRPRRGYQYGTSSVDDYDPFSTALSATGSAMFPTPSSAPASSMASRYKLPTPSPNYGLSIDSATFGGASSALGSSFGPTAGAAAGAGGFAPFDSLTHTQMMAEIAKKNMQAVAPQQSTQPASHDTQGYGSAFPATHQIGFSDLLSLSQGNPTRDPGLNVLNGISPEETARYWKHIDDISRGRA